MMATLEDWKKRQSLSDEDILTPGHLQRVAAQPPAQESEIVYCACGCGEFWLRPVDHVDRKQRFIRGHGPQRRPRRIRVESPKREEVIAVYRALRAREWTPTEKMAERTGLSEERCEILLGIMHDILSRPRLEVIKVGRMTAYRKEGS